MISKELECPVCRRVYEAEDVPDNLCPFCEPATTLKPVGGPKELISDVFSTGLGWPAGQTRVLLAVSPNYMDAQLTKAQLEANEIPVIIEGGGVAQVYSFTVGKLAEYKIYVPQDLLPLARQIVGKHYES